MSALAGVVVVVVVVRGAVTVQRVVVVQGVVVVTDVRRAGVGDGEAAVGRGIVDFLEGAAGGRLRASALSAAAAGIGGVQLLLERLDVVVVTFRGRHGAGQKQRGPRGDGDGNGQSAAS
jgi:hypothetical protein